MTADPWIVLTGHLQALAIGGRPTLNSARRETIKDATAAARRLFAPFADREPLNHELMLMAVADVAMWDRFTDNHLWLLIAAVEIERAARAEREHIERMVPLATSARWMKGAQG